MWSLIFLRSLVITIYWLVNSLPEITNIQKVNGIEQRLFRKNMVMLLKKRIRIMHVQEVAAMIY